MLAVYFPSVEQKVHESIFLTTMCPKHLSRPLGPAVEGKRIIGRVSEMSLEKSAVARSGRMDCVLNVVRSLWEFSVEESGVLLDIF